MEALWNNGMKRWKNETKTSDWQRSERFFLSSVSLPGPSRLSHPTWRKDSNLQDGSNQSNSKHQPETLKKNMMSCSFPPTIANSSFPLRKLWGKQTRRERTVMWATAKSKWANYRQIWWKSSKHKHQQQQDWL